MDHEQNKKEDAKQKMAEELGNAGAKAETVMERGAEVYGQAEQAVSDAYDKTAQVVSETYDKASQAVSETYDQAKSYSSENPGKTILITLGIGIGLGFILGASSRRSGLGSRFAQPVVHALSDIALEFFR
jgi:ElaB/YqjD/DUF883 family membrane-anchored ribosome-binding protein